MKNKTSRTKSAKDFERMTEALLAPEVPLAPLQLPQELQRFYAEEHGWDFEGLRRYLAHHVKCNTLDHLPKEWRSLAESALDYDIWYTKARKTLVSTQVLPLETQSVHVPQHVLDHPIFRRPQEFVSEHAVPEDEVLQKKPARISRDSREKVQHHVSCDTDKKHVLGHRQRLKARFLNHPQSLLDYEMLELLLYFVYPRQDVKPIAKDLLARHGSFQRVVAHMMNHGSENMKVVFHALCETARRLLLEDLYQGPMLNNSQKVVEYCHLTMARLTEETFRIFFLDRHYHLITEEAVQGGTVDEVSLHPREVIKRALALNATAIILVHNHPSGHTSPSRADMELTSFLKNSFLPFNIRLVDHFIVGCRGYFSFQENGLLG